MSMVGVKSAPAATTTSKGFPFVGAATSPRFERWTVDAARSKGGAVVRSLICDNYEMLVRLAETTNAIRFGPRNVLAVYECAWRVRVMPWQIDGPDTQQSVIHSKRRLLSPAARRLIELIENEDASGPE